MENEDVIIDLDNEDVDLEDKPTEEEKPKKLTDEEKLAKYEGITNRLRKKLGKDEAKKEVEEKPQPKPEKPKKGMSESDIFAVVRANISDEDIETVKRYATLNDISVKEALQAPDLVEILKIRAEQRKTNEVANVDKAKSGSEAMSDEALLEKVNEGYVPKPGSKEAEQLFWARRKKA